MGMTLLFMGLGTAVVGRPWCYENVFFENVVYNLDLWIDDLENLATVWPVSKEIFFQVLVQIPSVFLELSHSQNFYPGRHWLSLTFEPVASQCQGMRTC